MHKMENPNPNIDNDFLGRFSWEDQFLIGANLCVENQIKGL